MSDQRITPRPDGRGQIKQGGVNKPNGSTARPPDPAGSGGSSGTGGGKKK